MGGGLVGGSWWVGLLLWKKGPEKQVPHQVDPKRAPPGWGWGLGCWGKPDHPADSPPQARVRKMLAKRGLQRLSSVGLSTGCAQVSLWLQVYERFCVTQPPSKPLRTVKTTPEHFPHPSKLTLSPQRIAGPSHHSAKIEFPPK